MSAPSRESLELHVGEESVEVTRRTAEYDWQKRWIVVTEWLGSDEYGAAAIVARDVSPDWALRLLAGLSDPKPETPGLPPADMRLLGYPRSDWTVHRHRSRRRRFGCAWLALLLLALAVGG